MTKTRRAGFRKKRRRGGRRRSRVTKRGGRRRSRGTKRRSGGGKRYRMFTLGSNQKKSRWSRHKGW